MPNYQNEKIRLKPYFIFAIFLLSFLNKLAKIYQYGDVPKWS